MCDQHLATDSAARLEFFLVFELDGITPVTAEAGGQPQVALNDGSWSSSSIGTLVHRGNGHYYAAVDLPDLGAVVGDHVIGRYKASGVAEAPSLNVIRVYEDLILSKSGYALRAAGLEQVIVETVTGTDPDITVTDALAYIGAAVCGLLSGAATSEILCKAMGSISQNRLQATVTADGNRTAMTLTPP